MAMTAHEAALLLLGFVERLHGAGNDTGEHDIDALSVDGPSATSFGGITLLPHQVEGARRLAQILERHGGALLADEVGTGKTYTALRVARDAGPLLIVAPAALRDMWQDACRRCVVAADIVSYERLSARAEAPSPRWAMVILDEAHHARSPDTRRYRALATITRGARVLLLSATPLHNRRRDLRALFALFLGAAAHALDDAAVSALVVRRGAEALARPLPSLGRVQHHAVPRADEVLLALRSLPPPLPPADGGVAQALVALQLTRAWCSSDAALVTAIRRRLVAAAALEQSLEAGRLPSRRDLATWTADVDGSVQLGFPELIAGPAGVPSTRQALAVVRTHAAALRALRERVRGASGRDAIRIGILERVLATCDERQAVVFTHSAETAEAVFRALRGRFRLALLSGRGAALASGPVTRREVLTAFAPDGAPPHAPPHAIPRATARLDDPRRIDVLIATDVLSEGVDLQRAAVVVHLDLPWTVARMEQRMGRVRRMGSPHERVEAHLIAPPLGAAELESTLVHLVRKARLAGTLLGASRVLGDATHWRDLLPPTAALSLTGARDAIVAALRTLASRALESPAPRATRRAPTAAGASDPCKPTVARVPQDAQTAHIARWHVPCAREPVTLALVSLAGNAQLIVATPGDLIIDPVAVARALTQLVDGDSTAAPSVPAPPCDARRPHACVGAIAAPGRSPIDPRPRSRTSRRDRAPGGRYAEHASRAERRVLDWCLARDAEQQMDPAPTLNSRSHRRLLHALDALPSRAPRPRRAHVALIATEARRLVLAQHGVGAERLLDDLADVLPAPTAGFAEDDRWLDRVVATLRAEPHRHSSPTALDAPDGSADARTGATLAAMLTLLPVPHLP